MTHDADLRDRLKTVHTYAATPFTDDLLQLDLPGFERNLEFLVEHGMKVIAVGGGTGEIETLTVDDLETLVGTALRTVDGRALVIACLPANLGEAIELLGRYERLGVEICLGMPPLIRSKIPADLSGTWNYFNELGRATGLPLMPYNTQGWPAEFVVELAEIEAIIGVKDPCFPATRVLPGNPHAGRPFCLDRQQEARSGRGTAEIPDGDGRLHLGTGQLFGPNPNWRSTRRGSRVTGTGSSRSSNEWRYSNSCGWPTTTPGWSRRAWTWWAWPVERFARHGWMPPRKLARPSARPWWRRSAR
ncbi:MAG: hypothetical protein Ct9H300mP1_23860 [Planctomycetaceae bacterium]|nr:MAG: hypothetical protein Ct9H300mP1_23860 [Planctomycetaceae bacterium]